MAKNSLILMIFLFTCGPSALARGYQCHDLFESRISFHISEFEIEKRNWALRLQSNDPLIPSLEGQNLSPLSRLALVETIAEQNGLDLLRIDDLLATRRGKKRVMKIMRGWKEDALPEGKIERLMVRLYLLANANHFSILPRRIQFNRILEERIGSEFVAHDVVEALRRLGFVRDPEGFERLSEFRKRYQNLENLLITGALSATMFVHFGSLGSVPNVRIARQHGVPQEIVDKIRTQGLNATHDDLRILFRSDAQFQLAWNSTQIAVRTTMMAFAAYMISQYLPSISILYNELFGSEDLSKSQFEGLAAEVTSRFEAWRRDFLARNRREPELSLDASEWAKISSEIQTLQNKSGTR